MRPETFYALAKVLPNFFEAMDRDPRLSSTHVSLYFSLIRQWASSEFSDCIRIYARQGALKAKISTVSYTRCLKDLHAFGYLHYVPSYNSAIASSIYLCFEGNFRTSGLKEIPADGLTLD
ncbi:hypothetical protein CHU00_07470 [Sphingobacterium cellulitidis]|uniref:hypothetical protein n=1 Tax=Sphingobacterium TaxID=28453 RepID=UPI000B93FA52|nr:MULTISPECIES: hypothetical protein [Sphingobacterium]OYD41817.1 hypothetical protein CHT99_11435 [Sphingobacterium cellulitidis]OYD46508.1 hypothetical protein CHU00_07470 [Sphingobacterium cellulitidis]WFB63236.1 hypothetical protein PZ892_16375 [Sphingobacterium sp. WM]